MFEIVYKILVSELASRGIYFREIVTGFRRINLFIFFITVIIIIVTFILDKSKGSLIGRIVYWSFIILGIVALIFFLIFNGLVRNTEVIAMRAGEKYVVVSGNTFLTSSRVTFYNYQNMFIMKKSNIKTFYCEQGNRLYLYRKPSNSDNKDIDISLEYNFRMIKPLEAVEIFGGGNFEYLDLETYDFGNTIIKFNKIIPKIVGIISKRRRKI